MAAPEIPASESTLSKLTEQLKDQNNKLGELVGQGEDQIDAADDAARAQREAAREAARAAGDDAGPEIAVKVEVEEAPGLFKKLKLGAIALSIVNWAMAGLTSAFSSLGAMFSPGLIKFFKGASPWALIITGLSLAIEDGITGYLSAD